jgi:hypothetical protein
VGQRADAGQSGRARWMRRAASSMPVFDGMRLSWRGRVGR